MRVLYIDIETSPTLADVWRFYNENISIAQVRRSTRVLCFAAKWAGEEEVMFWSAWDTSNELSYKRTIMIGAAWNLLDEADVVVTYNGDHFDIKTLNREFWLMDLTKPSPFVSADLLKVVRKNFLFPSNKLDFIVQQKGIGRKVPHSGHELWVQVQAGNAKAQAEMEEYNIHDVVLLEDLYESLESWLPLSINQNLLSGDGIEGCPFCGRIDTLVKRGYRYTLSGKYQRYQCNACDRWSQGTKRLEGTGVKPI